MGCIFSKDSDVAPDHDMSTIRDRPVIFVNGVPGAGSQTVSQTISNITGYLMIRPGELVRQEAAKDTPRGRLIADHISRCDDVAEQIVVDLIKETMLANEDAKGYILVGFPKTLRMSYIFKKQVKEPEKIVSVEVDADVATARLQERLSELGRPQSEVLAAKETVRKAISKVKSVQRRFAPRVVKVNSGQNPSAIAQELKELLALNEEEVAKDEAEDKYSELELVEVSLDKKA